MHQGRGESMQPFEGGKFSERTGGQAIRPACSVTLRLLETTDVHGNLFPFDYFSDAPDERHGLARTATLIRRARAEARNSLLFDCGDFLQGTPMSDITGQPGSGWTGAHPAIRAMNLLGYDAAAIGNHEFNFGLDWLTGTLAAARFPLTCANVVQMNGTPPGTEPAWLPAYLILERQLQDDDGGCHDIRIGVFGLVPPQVTTWDQFYLRDRLASRDIVETARELVPRIRATGADLVIALAHTGIGDGTAHPMMENAALPLAAVDGIDAVLAGHSHEVFPDPEGDDSPGADSGAGTLNGTPAVMAGFRGSHLGVLDLDLTRSRAQWRVTGHRAETRPVAAGRTAPPAPPDKAVTAALAGAHEKTLALVRRPLGHTDAPLHSYLALVRNDPAVQLVTEAQRTALRRRLAGTAHASLPVLSAAAPFKTGGRGGPDYFTDIPAGGLRLRHVADLYPFPNTLTGLRLSGAELREWLERAATCFNQLVPGQSGQMLLSGLPGHNFDIADGVTYRIDLTRPPRYDARGMLADPGARRIRDLRHEGRPVADVDEFVLATNHYRAHGGGPYPEAEPGRIVFRCHLPVPDLLAEHIARAGQLVPRARAVWSFAPMPRTSAVIETGPGLRRYPADIAAIGAEDLGDTPRGFARFRLALPAVATAPWDPCESGP